MTGALATNPPKRELAAAEVETVETMAAEGASIDAIRGELRLGKGTFARMRDEDEAVDVAFAAGRSRHQRYLLGKLHDHIENNTLSKTQLTAVMYSLKAMHGLNEVAVMREIERLREVHTERVVIFDRPPANSVEEYRRELQAEAIPAEVVSDGD